MKVCPVCNRGITMQNPLGEKDDVVACKTCLTPKPPIAFDTDLPNYSQPPGTPVDTIAVEFDVCTVCGKPIAIGQQPCVFRIIDHAPVGEYHPFIPYFDFALGVQVDSLAQRWRLMKPEMDGDEVSRGKLEYRDKMSKGDLSARNDRIHERLQAKDRAARG